MRWRAVITGHKGTCDCLSHQMVAHNQEVEWIPLGPQALIRRYHGCKLSVTNNIRPEECLLVVVFYLNPPTVSEETIFSTYSISNQRLSVL